jgi:hypothetical protein
MNNELVSRSPMETVVSLLELEMLFSSLCVATGIGVVFRASFI